MVTLHHLLLPLIMFTVAIRIKVVIAVRWKR